MIAIAARRSWCLRAWCWCSPPPRVCTGSGHSRCGWTRLTRSRKRYYPSRRRSAPRSAAATCPPTLCSCTTLSPSATVRPCCARRRRSSEWRPLLPRCCSAGSSRGRRRLYSQVSCSRYRRCSCNTRKKHACTRCSPLPRRWRCVVSLGSSSIPNSHGCTRGRDRKHPSSGPRVRRGWRTSEASPRRYTSTILECSCSSRAVPAL